MTKGGYRQNRIDLAGPCPVRSHFPRHCSRFPTLLLAQLNVERPWSDHPDDILGTHRCRRSSSAGRWWTRCRVPRRLAWRHRARRRGRRVRGANRRRPGRWSGGRLGRRSGWPIPSGSPGGWGEQDGDVAGGVFVEDGDDDGEAGDVGVVEDVDPPKDVVAGPVAHEPSPR